MSNEAIDLGCTPNGAHLFRKPNSAGGYTYYSDEIGGGVIVWDTCLVAQSTLLAAISHERHRKHLSIMVENKGFKPNPSFDTEKMAVTGRSFISKELMKELETRAKEKDGQ